MTFDMTTPCPKCPFRTDVTPYLTPARAREISTSLVQRQESFPCHQTTEHDDDGECIRNPEKEKHCAGAMIMLEHMNKPNQMMRIAERIGFYDRFKLKMDAPVFATAAAFIAAQRSRRRK